MSLNQHNFASTIVETSARGGALEDKMAAVLSGPEKALIDAYWRAANYLSVGQIYLYDNPLLESR